MGTKEQLLALFESNKGVYFSGEAIAQKLCVSRTAVWKAVKTLRSEGYNIDAVSNKGYCLSVTSDILSVQGIQKYLNPLCSDVKLAVFPVVESTNEMVRKEAALGTTEGYTVIANEQTSGKGRIGRSFFSPSDTGIYMSMLLRPQNYSSQQAVRITTMAAVAACEAIEAVSDERAQIKWVNDIYIGEKKVSGILTEASFGLESGLLDYAVLGIGINVYAPKEGFPKEIENIAGTVFHTSHNDGKNRLAAEFLNRFMAYYTARDQTDYVEKYRNRSMVIGKEIQVLFAGKSEKALALGIDENCRLLVRYEDGREESLSSGEISVRFS
ncbi:MAG: biotin--[acetyl-CoA-carboxylase] ligase [Lachnospiraceae bacterium]|nr:biotin--[acetyl-CoA-carboxylase] ligase [Lachnospiraceae bacterium]